MLLRYQGGRQRGHLGWDRMFPAVAGYAEGAREWHLLDDVCGTEFSLDGCGAKAQVGRRGPQAETATRRRCSAACGRVDL
eukprot:1989954-Pyramimonas_sp.AAC.1